MAKNTFHLDQIEMFSEQFQRHVKMLGDAAQQMRKSARDQIEVNFSYTSDSSLDRAAKRIVSFVHAVHSAAMTQCWTPPSSPKGIAKKRKPKGVA